MKIVSIITIYNPQGNIEDNINRIIKQSDKVILCDNGNKKIDYFQESENLVYIKNGTNLGLSAAFNMALNLSDMNWSDDDFVVFFDQDSKIEDGHIKTLLSEYETVKSLGNNIGCIGPAYYNKSAEQYCIPKMKKDITKTAMSVKSIITSSMMCRYGDLKKIGFWNEDIFLDMADWDLCWRFQQHGYICCMTTKVCLLHKLGEGSKKIGFLTLKIAKPFREYYQTRDSLKLLKKLYTPFKYKIRFILMLTVRPVLHLLFLDDKKERFKYICAGIKDYKKGVTGALK